MWRNTGQALPRGLSREEVGFSLGNTQCYPAKQQEEAKSEQTISKIEIPKSWIKKASILSIYRKWTSPHWVPSTCAIKLMQVVLHQNCVVHQGGSMYLDRFVDLVKVDWINMSPSMFTPKGALNKLIILTPFTLGVLLILLKRLMGLLIQLFILLVIKQL